MPSFKFSPLSSSYRNFQTKNQTSHHNIVIIGSFSLYGLIISFIIAKHVAKSDRWFIGLTIIAYIFSLVSFINLMYPLLMHQWRREDYTENSDIYKLSFFFLILSTIAAISAVSLKKHVRDYDEMMGELISTVWLMLVLQIVFVLCSFIFGYRDFFISNDEQD